MTADLNKFKAELDELIVQGKDLRLAMLFECYKDDTEAEETVKKLKEHEMVNFSSAYQSWYTLSMQVVKQVLPDRLSDFLNMYQNERRKEINRTTYLMSDYLDGTIISQYGRVVANRKSALSKFERQLDILMAARDRLQSSICDIKDILEADLFDEEIMAAYELNKKGFTRAAGALAGVVLEGHLGSVCNRHELALRKKAPSINDWNQLLKDNELIDTPTWRFIQHLGDIRNICSHKKDKEPSSEEVEDLLNGTKKVIKTVF